MIDEQNQLETTSDKVEKGEMGNSVNQDENVPAATETVSTFPETTATPEASSTSVSEEQPPLESPAPIEQSELVIAALQEEAASLKQQLQEQIQQVDTLKKRYLGIAAEFDNFRKRTLKEKEDLEKQVKCKTLSELLPVVDNFERARTQIKPDTDGEMEIHKSYQGVYRNLVDSLKRLGVAAMRPEGQSFDPIYHEAMLREYTDEYPEGTVLEQLVRGYSLGDQVLRHAMVKVAAAKEPVVSSEGEALEEPGDVNSTDN